MAYPRNPGEFIESLRDGREVYIYGERVKDVIPLPRFRVTRNVAPAFPFALNWIGHEKGRSTIRDFISDPVSNLLQFCTPDAAGRHGHAAGSGQHCRG